MHKLGVIHLGTDLNLELQRFHSLLNTYQNADACQSQHFLNTVRIFSTRSTHFGIYPIHSLLCIVWVLDQKKRFETAKYFAIRRTKS